MLNDKDKKLFEKYKKRINATATTIEALTESRFEQTLKERDAQRVCKNCDEMKNCNVRLLVVQNENLCLTSSTFGCNDFINQFSPKEGV